MRILLIVALFTFFAAGVVWACPACDLHPDRGTVIPGDPPLGMGPPHGSIQLEGDMDSTDIEDGAWGWITADRMTLLIDGQTWVWSQQFGGYVKIGPPDQIMIFNEDGTWQAYEFKPTLMAYECVGNGHWHSLPAPPPQ